MHPPPHSLVHFLALIGIATASPFNVLGLSNLLPKRQTNNFTYTTTTIGKGSATETLKLPSTTYNPNAHITAPVSPDGTCGDYAGYTCLGSGFGECCSIYGYCGDDAAHCYSAQCDWGDCPPRSEFSTRPTTTAENPASSTCQVYLNIPPFCGSVPPYSNAAACYAAASSCDAQAAQLTSLLAAEEYVETQVDFGADAKAAGFRAVCDATRSVCGVLAAYGHGGGSK